MKDIIVEIKGLEKTYGKNEAETKAIQGIDLTITREEFVSIVGKSGSGKSTLLNIIGGLERPTSGEVQIEGTNLFDMKDTSRTIFRRKHIGYVFQFFNLIPEMTVYENICLPSYLDHKDPDEDFIQTVMEKLKRKENMLQNFQEENNNELLLQEHYRLNLRFCLQMSQVGIWIRKMVNSC